MQSEGNYLNRITLILNLSKARSFEYFFSIIIYAEAKDTQLATG